MQANVPALTAIITSRQGETADGRGPDEGADGNRGADLRDELLAGGRTADARDQDAVLWDRAHKPHLCD